MNMIKGKTLSDAYKSTIKYLLLHGRNEGNTLELTNFIFEVKEPSLEDIHFPFRKISKKYVNTELEWYWTGDNSVDKIGKVAKLWYDISDDGETSNSAYGYIIHKKHDKDQLKEVLKMLQKDPSSRKAVINIIDPKIDKLTTKDLQCTVALQFLIRDNKLNMTVFMRSNDVYYGLPYDSIYFISLQEWLADKLNIKTGTYVHHATSMHLYTKDIDKLKAHEQIITIGNFKTLYD